MSQKVIQLAYMGKFVEKCSIPNYPMRGFYIKIGNYDPNLDIQSNFGVAGLGESSTTKTYISNTFLYDDKIRFSFNCGEPLIETNKNNCIWLFALDLFNNDDFADIDYTNSPELLGQLAGIIYDPTGVIDNMNTSLTNIIEIPYPDEKFKCSFETTCDNLNPEVNHYNGNDLGQLMYHDQNVVENSLIDRNSGISKLRESVTYIKDHDLNGTMTIKKSGIIQL